VNEIDATNAGRPQLGGGRVQTGAPLVIADGRGRRGLYQPG
jgi:hypothetical protein